MGTGVAISPTFLRSNPLTVKEMSSSHEEIGSRLKSCSLSRALSGLLPKHFANA